MTQQLGRAPEDGELAWHLGVREDDVRQARRAQQAFTAYSLDAPLPDRDSTALLADILGEDDPAVTTSSTSRPSAPTWTSRPNASSGS